MEAIATQNAIGKRPNAPEPRVNTSTNGNPSLVPRSGCSLRSANIIVTKTINRRSNSRKKSETKRKGNECEAEAERRANDAGAGARERTQ